MAWQRTAKTKPRIAKAHLSAIGLVALALSQTLAAAGEDALTLSLESLPLFAFADDRLQIAVILRQEREKPPRGEEKNTRQALAALAVGERQRQDTQTVAVPPYRDRAALCQWTIEMATLPHGAKLVFSASWSDNPATVCKELAAVWRVDQPCPALAVDGNHLRDPEGRRVILAIPRRQEAAQRRWLAARVLAFWQESGKNDIALAAGVYGGSTRYAEIFREQWLSQAGRTCALLLARESEWPILDLIAVVLAGYQGQGRSSVAFFPGNDDARLCIPLEEYYLGLHAAAAALESHGQPMVLAMAMPPASVAGLARVERYREVARRVANERGWRCVDVPAAAAQEPIIARAASEDEHRQLAESLLASVVVFSWREALLVLPLAMLAIASLATLWLWLFARADRTPSLTAAKGG